jgi:ABC-type Mn2+/Zn2+ transport system ATPase subunit
MEPADLVLDVKHLSIRFGRTSALTDVSFRVPTGTTLAIIGPNGSGKTVLFKALIGAIKYEGEVQWKSGTRLGRAQKPISSATCRSQGWIFSVPGPRWPGNLIPESCKRSP